MDIRKYRKAELANVSFSSLSLLFPLTLTLTLIFFFFVFISCKKQNEFDADQFDDLDYPIGGWEQFKILLQRCVMMTLKDPKYAFFFFLQFSIFLFLSFHESHFFFKAI